MESGNIVPQVEVKHRSFNPIVMSLGVSPLQFLCESMEEDGWQLMRVVPNHQYETVAVFQRPLEDRA